MQCLTGFEQASIFTWPPVWMQSWMDGWMDGETEMDRKMYEEDQYQDTGITIFCLCKSKYLMAHFMICTYIISKILCLVVILEQALLVTA